MKGELSILLVDADESYRTLLQNKLEEHDDFHVVASVSDGNTALLEIRDRKPQFVIMDIVLPGLDGLSLLRKVMQENHLPKVIVLSQWMRSDIVYAAFSQGAIYYLGKPCDMDALAEQMRESVRRVRLAAPWSDIEAERITVETLYQLGVSPACAGMALARDMVLMAAKEPDTLRAVAERIYSPFLRDGKDSIKRIERSLRYVIETAWNNADAAEYQAKLFGNTVRSRCGRPSNGTFLAVVSEHVRMEMQRENLRIRQCGGDCMWKQVCEE